jgi:hypothetical protein
MLVEVSQLYMVGYSDMDLGNKEYPQVELRFLIYIFNTVLEIRDTKQQYLTTAF